MTTVTHDRMVWAMQHNDASYDGQFYAQIAVDPEDRRQAGFEVDI